MPRAIVSVTAKNSEQKDMLKAIANNNITFVRGVAGTGKTYVAVGYALQELLKDHYEHLILTRPVVEAGEKLGFLPGDLEEKISPYMIPIFYSMEQLLGDHKSLLKKLTNKNGEQPKIRVLPLAYMRGCAQPLYSKILTPTGWVTMGDIQPGDQVIGGDGLPTTVLNVYPQGSKPIYRIFFTDGTHADCCEDHLWLTQTLIEKRHKKPYSVKKTKDIIDSIKTRFGQKIHRIPISQTIEFDNQQVEIDPYLLGLLLGDGSLHKEASITFSTADTELLDEIQQRLPSGMQIKPSIGYDYRLVKADKYKSNNLKSMLRTLNLLGTTSHSKFIPEMYKFNSSDIRLEILRGLMDTDGSIFKHNSSNRRIQYYSVSESLANDVQFLVQSLGGISIIRKRKFNKKTSKLANGIRKWVELDTISSIFVVDIIIEHNIFRLGRKSELFAIMGSPLLTKLISNAQYVGDIECQCIKVDNDTHLYLTDYCIVTHNTFSNSVIICDEMQNSTPAQMRMVLTRFGEGSKMIVCGDIKQSDISRYNGLEDAFRLLPDIKGVGFVTLSRAAVVRHPIIRDIDEKYENRERAIIQENSNVN